MLSGARFPLLRVIFFFGHTGCCRERKDCGSEAVKAFERDTRASIVLAHGRSPVSRMQKKQTLLLVEKVVRRRVETLLSTVPSRDLRCGSQHASSKRMAV